MSVPHSRRRRRHRLYLFDNTQPITCANAHICPSLSTFFFINHFKISCFVQKCTFLKYKEGQMGHWGLIYNLKPPPHHFFFIQIFY